MCSGLPVLYSRNWNDVCNSNSIIIKKYVHVSVSMHAASMTLCACMRKCMLCVHICVLCAFVWDVCVCCIRCMIWCNYVCFFYAYVCVPFASFPKAGRQGSTCLVMWLMAAPFCLRQCGGDKVYRVPCVGLATNNGNISCINIIQHTRECCTRTKF